MNEFLVANVEWVLSMAFMAGGGWYALRKLTEGLRENREEMQRSRREMNERFDRVDRRNQEQDEDINELKIQVARHDEKLSIVEELKTMVHDIWKRTVGKG